MIGTDITDISRYQDWEKIAARILSEEEKAELGQRPLSRKAEYVASRFAGKEAFLKACRKLDLKMSEISITDDPQGRPHLTYRGREAGEISLSHDKFALAFVVLKDDFRI
jgi:holo-[acyl-carrier protein] synthase